MDREEDGMRPPAQPGDTWSCVEVGALVTGAQLDTKPVQLLILS